MQRTVTLACGPADARHLAEAVRAYAHTAFPPGGSECAQVSREALLDAAAGIATTEGELVLRRRQLAQMRAAVEWYFEDGSGKDVGTAGRLREMLRR